MFESQEMESEGKFSIVSSTFIFKNLFIYWLLGYFSDRVLVFVLGDDRCVPRLQQMRWSQGKLFVKTDFRDSLDLCLLKSWDYRNELPY
jgi:hypothetical protein